MAEHSFSRRDFLRLASATAAGAVLASCTPKAESPAEPAASGPVNLEYWFCWSGRYQEIQRSICDAFQKEVGDKITVRKREKSEKYVRAQMALLEGVSNPPPQDWLQVDPAKLEATVVSLPGREHVLIPIEEQLVVEFCSR